MQAVCTGHVARSEAPPMLSVWAGRLTALERSQLAKHFESGKQIQGALIKFTIFPAACPLCFSLNGLCRTPIYINGLVEV